MTEVKKITQQQNAYIGDALCKFIVGDYFIKEMNISDFDIMQKVLTNANMKQAATSLRINVYKRNNHSAGTRYESYVAKYYYKHGIDKTKEMVVESLINTFFKNIDKKQ